MTVARMTATKKEKTKTPRKRRTVARPVAPRYNVFDKQASSREDEFVKRLQPLKQNETVWLSLDDGKPVSGKTRQPKKPKLVGVTPGPAIGLRDGLILIAIIGSGSCIVPANRGAKLDKLVLAGMPGRLAAGLMNAIHTVTTQE